MIAPAEIEEMFYEIRFQTAESGIGGLKFLISRGVSFAAATEPDPPIAASIIVSGQHFDVAAHGEGDALRAILILARNPWGASDVIAWIPRRRKGLFSWLGAAHLLGEEELYSARLGTGLPIFRDPLGWFRAGRRGCVLLDSEKAAAALAGRSIEAEDAAHARELRRLLTREPFVTWRRAAVEVA